MGLSKVHFPDSGIEFVNIELNEYTALFFLIFYSYWKNNQWHFWWFVFIEHNEYFEFCWATLYIFLNNAKIILGKDLHFS